MKNIYFFLISLLFPFLLHAQGFNSIHTSNGINVFAVGDQGRIYRSSNTGNSWYIYSYTTNDFKSVFTFSSDVWFGGSSGTVYKTNFSASPILNFFTGDNFMINSIFFVDSNLGYLCGEGGKIFKSVNGGLNWILTNSGIDNIRLNSISFKDSQNGIVVADNGKVFITVNGGLNWTPESIPTTKNLLDVKYFSEGISVVGEYGVLLIKPNSSSWSLVNTRTNSDIRGISGTSISDIHVCGGGGFIRNNKNGKDNFLNFEVNPMLANLVDIFYYNSNLGFAVSSFNKAVIKTTNGGLSWELPPGATISKNWVSKTPSGSGIGNNLCMHPKDRNSAFVVYGNKVYVSRDRSETWTQIATISIGSRAHSFYISPVDTNIWVAAIESSPDRIVRSTDYGSTWNTIIAYDFSSYGQPLEMDQNNPSVFYYAPSNASGTGLFKSTDNGATFTLVAPYNSSAINQPCDIIIEWGNPLTIFLGDDGADIFRSTNGGLNWAIVKPGSSSEVPSMCNTVFDPTLCYATTWSSSQVWKTVNSGDNWTVASNNSGSGWASDICHEDPTVVLTGNYGSQSYLSTNNGISFSTVSTGLSGAGAGMMVPERGYFLNMQTGNLFKMNITYNVLDSGIVVPPPTIAKINLKVIVEGMYFPLFNQLSRRDTFMVYLRASVSPYLKIDSAKAVMDSLSFSGLFTFNNTPTGTYYIVTKHFNSIETWSKNGGEFILADGSIRNYDFTNSITQAYGNNLKLKGSKYTIYSGDVNQDGIVDGSDLIRIHTDANNFVTGIRIPTDLNGDNIVDGSDYSIGDNNGFNYVTVFSPLGNPLSRLRNNNR